MAAARMRPMSRSGSAAGCNSEEQAASALNPAINLPMAHQAAAVRVFFAVFCPTKLRARTMSQSVASRQSPAAAFADAIATIYADRPAAVTADDVTTAAVPSKDAAAVADDVCAVLRRRYALEQRPTPPPEGAAGTSADELEELDVLAIDGALAALQAQVAGVDGELLQLRAAARAHDKEALPGPRNPNPSPNPSPNAKRNRNPIPNPNPSPSPSPNPNPSPGAAGAARGGRGARRGRPRDALARALHRRDRRARRAPQRARAGDRAAAWSG